MMNYLAHSANKQGDAHLAKEHLANSARLATEFAGKSSWSEEATLAGLLHDLGKYADLFQARLRGEASGLDHWSAGAWVALSEYKAVAAALAIHQGAASSAHANASGFLKGGDNLSPPLK